MVLCKVEGRDETVDAKLPCINLRGLICIICTLLTQHKLAGPQDKSDTLRVKQRNA